MFFFACLIALQLINYNNSGYKNGGFLPSIANSTQPTDVSILHNKPKLFCIILTSKNSIETRGKAVLLTWAKKCETFKFVIKTDPNTIKEIPTENILNPKELLVDVYQKLTDKVYYTFKQIYNEYEPHDWYLKSDDDSFIFVENLKEFLLDKNSLLPVTYGYDFKVIVPKGYHSGGAGYVLSREAFSRIGQKLTDNFTFCQNTGIEDVDVAYCLRNLQVYPNKSLDSLGRERFHPYNVSAHFNGYHFQDWIHYYSANPLKKV